MTFSANSPATISEIIFKGFNLLRGKVDVKDYHAFSFLLYLQSRGIIKNTTRLKPYNVRSDIYEKVLLPEYQHKDKVALLIQYFQNSINRIEDQTLYDLLSLIESVDPATLHAHIGDMIDEMVHHIAKSEGRHGGEYIQPYELSKFIIALADIPEGATVYNPFAGVASFGMYLNEGVKYFGQELNAESHAIGTLRLLANNKASDATLVTGDSVKNWNPQHEYYDFILTNPPFSVTTGLSDSKATINLDAIIVNKILENLTENNTAIIVLPQNFLYSKKKEHRDLRNTLVKYNYLKSIISFPGGMLTNTSVPFVVLVLNYSRRQRHEILFVDATTTVKDISKRDKKLDYEHLLYIMSKPELPHAKLVSIDEILENNLNLNVARYLFNDKTPLNGVELGVLLRRAPKAKNVISGNRYSLSNDNFASSIRLKDLKDDKRDFVLDLDKVDYSESKRNVTKLDKSALLITTKWKSLKPTYFNFNGIPLLLPSEIVAFEVNEMLVDIAYLINELHADYVLDQLNRYRIGAAIPFIPIEDFLKVKITLPELKEQRAKVTGDAFKSVEAAEALVKKQAFEELASIKHSMGKPLLNLNAGVRNIEATLTKMDQDWHSVIMSKKTGYTLGDAVNALFENLSLLTNLLKNNERELDVSAYPLTQVNAITFFKQYVNDLIATDGNKCEVSLDISPDLESEFEGSVIINANEELIKIAMNNIVDNAHRHGFTQHNKKYKIEMRLNLQLEKDAAFLKVEVANNGEPFPKNFNLDKLIRKASTAGTTGNSGVGGYDINEVVKRHNGKFDIETDPKVADPFTTIYEILIPINASNGNNE